MLVSSSKVPYRALLSEAWIALKMGLMLSARAALLSGVFGFKVWPCSTRHSGYGQESNRPEHCQMQEERPCKSEACEQHVLTHSNR